MGSDNVIENTYNYKYKCELCKKQCDYGKVQLQKIVDKKIKIVCEDCYND